MKTCNQCHRDLPLDHFYIDSTRPDGRRGNCKACHWQTRRTPDGQPFRVPPVSKRCLHGKCHREGVDQPEGYGFRFCDRHLPAWEKVRDRTGPPLSTQRNRREKRFRRCARGHKIIGNNITPGRRSCRACENARNATRRNPTIDPAEYAHKKYKQYLGAAAT